MTLRSEKEIPSLSKHPLLAKGVGIRSALVSWYQANERPLPWRVLWRQNQDPYQIWVSEIMLQQTLIQAVIPIYERFLEKYPDVYALSRAHEEDVKKAVQGLGYYRRFRLLHQAAQSLVKQYPKKSDFRWPSSFEGWLALPGIGTYTASAVSSIAFGWAAAVVDGNVERVLCRLFDVRLAPNLPALKKQFQTISNGFIDPKRPGDYNQAVMELGQTVCTVSSPNCKACPVQKYCRAYALESIAEAPQPKLKKETTDVKMHLFIVKKGQRYAVFHRPLTARFLKETPGFLTLSTAKGSLWGVDGLPSLSFKVAAKALGQVKHSITHHKIRAEVHVVDDLSAKGLRKSWFSKKELEANLISSLDRKAWRLYQAQKTP